MLLTAPNSWGAADENMSDLTDFGQSPGMSTSDYGSYTTLDFVTSGTTLDFDVYEVRINYGRTRASGVNRSALFRIAADPAGTPQVLVSGLVFANVDDAQQGGEIALPLYIPAGTTLGIAGYGAASTSAPVVGVTVFGRPSRPEMVWAGSGTETIGAGAGVGVDLSTAAIGSATLGTWTSIGTTTKPCKYWYLGAQVGTTDAPDGYGWLEFGYGDGSTIVPIGQRMRFRTLATEGILVRSSLQSYADVPAGSTLYVRGQANVSLADDNINCTAVGVY